MPGNLILLVEDNQDDEILMLDALRRCAPGAQIMIARNGAEALDYLLPKADRIEPAELPRLILLDVKLPKVTGLEVLRRLRMESRTRYVPIVMLSSSSERKDIEHSYELGANAYVRKLIDFQQFMEAVSCIEKFWMLFNETVY